MIPRLRRGSSAASAGRINTRERGVFVSSLRRVRRGAPALWFFVVVHVLRERCGASWIQAIPSGSTDSNRNTDNDEININMIVSINWHMHIHIHLNIHTQIRVRIHHHIRPQDRRSLPSRRSLRIR